MAECHPVGFQWVMEAKLRGAKVIHVDPRFTRTSAVADLHVPVRAGSDIAFLGGLINYVLANDAYFHDYVVAYTNAPMIVSDDFRDTEDLAGLFSGFDVEGRQYDTSSWQYRDGGSQSPAAGARDAESGETEASGSGGALTGSADEVPQRDDSLRDRDASSRYSSGTSSGTRPRWSSRRAVFRARASSRWPGR